MSEDDDQKTESATQRQRDRFAEEGSVAVSRDLTGAVTLAAGGIAALTLGRDALQNVVHGLTESLSNIGTASLDGALWQATVGGWAHAVLPITGVCAMAAGAAGLAQMGSMRRTKMPSLRLSALNPMARAGQLFAPAKLAWAIAKQLLKMILVAAALRPILSRAQAQLDGAHPANLAEGLGMLGGSLHSAVINAVFALLVIGAVDWAYAKYQLEKRMRMTKQEVKQEGKEEQGNPQVKGRMRQMRRALSRRRMMADVKTADVIVVNPTHYAVALKYSQKRMGAPRVVAKGLDSVALKIKEVAREHKVPIIENVPLARALHAQVKIGKEVPTALYRAVAEVLAAVYRMRPRRTA